MKRERKKERECVCVTCTRKQKVQLCSKHSSFSQSVSMRDYILYICVCMTLKNGLA